LLSGKNKHYEPIGNGFNSAQEQNFFKIKSHTI
jgi:hypothetical protein